jgi:Tol biopolymer transport system component
MQRITWYFLLAIAALVTPPPGRAQAPAAQMPRANVRELVTVDGLTSGFVLLPGGNTLIYGVTSDHTEPNQPRVDGDTFAYDVATKRRTLLGANMRPVAVSPRGDRLAFTRSSENPTESFLWTMPIDPKTGIGTGQAQRVSLRPVQRNRASFSPDGNALAFKAGPLPNGSWEVTIVPATGGPERVVKSYPGNSLGVAWSTDGLSLYLERDDVSPQTSIERVPVAGGPSTPLVARTQITNKQAAGLSGDARVAFFHDNPDRFFYRTASGVDGEISAVLPPLDDGWGYNLTLDSSMRYTTMTQVVNRRVRVLDLATGQARDLLPDVLTSAPAWSPDGRRLAVLTGSLSHRDIIVMNRDGSGQRRYPLSLHVSVREPNPMQRPWSPDGRYLAFVVDDEYKVAGAPTPAPRQIAILDLGSGQARVLKMSSGEVSRFRWRADARAIRAAKRTVSPNASQTRWRVVELQLDGTERTLRDISAEFPIVRAIGFPSDRVAAVLVTGGQKPERFHVPLDGGAARRQPDPGIEPGSQMSGELAAGDRLVMPVADARGVRALKIQSMVDDSTRTVRLPFIGTGAMIFPDGQHVACVGRPENEGSTNKLYLVPLDGTPTRQIGEIPRGSGGLLAPSPDGKLLAYTSDGPITSTILQIDFGPALQAIATR